jgi:hypothetical protein
MTFHSVEVGSPPYSPIIHVRKLEYSLPLTALSTGSSRINFLWMYKDHYYYYHQQVYPLTTIAKCRVYIFSVVRSMSTLYTPMICLASFGVSWALNLIYGVIPRSYMTGWMATFKMKSKFNCHLSSIVDAKSCGLLTTPLQSHSGSVGIPLIRVWHSWREDFLLQNKVMYCEGSYWVLYWFVGETCLECRFVDLLW